MAKSPILVDTDIFIDYFNTGRFHTLFDSDHFTVYYSIVTKKELLTKPGLRDSEQESILAELIRCRLITLSDSITVRYSELRRRHPSVEKGGALIAPPRRSQATSPAYGNTRHFRMINGLVLFKA